MYKLNDEQELAINTKLGNNLVIASAGTGKTSTIVGRIAKLLNDGTHPANILLLTFTNKASKEMIARLEKFFPTNITKQIEAGTFHSVAYRYLKNLDDKLMLKQLSELRTLFKTVYEKRSFNKLEQGYYTASYLFDIYSLFQNKETGESFKEFVELNYEKQESYLDIYEDIVLEYEELKNSFSFLSFNDLLIKAIEKLEKNPVHYSEVLVDEYQDTNTLQGKFIEKLKAKSLFCVGDFDQSIYAFNGANIEIIANFSKNFEDAQVFFLKKNYRSTAYIIDLANKVIANNPRIYNKELEVARKDTPQAPKLLAYNELFAQYKGIASKIKHSSYNKEEIAIIFRNNSSADGIEACLKEENIASKRRGGVSFFEAKEVRALLDLYTIFINQNDMMAFIHIYEYAQNIGANISQEIFLALKKLGNGFIKDGLLKPKDIKNPFEARSVNSQLALFDEFSLGSGEDFKKDVKNICLKNSSILKHSKLSREAVLFLDNLCDIFSTNISNPFNFLDYLQNTFIYKKIVEKLARKRAILKNNEFRRRALQNCFGENTKKNYLAKKP